MDANGHIPMDVMEKILLNLPVKSLIRFRCVSRSWNSMICEPSFIMKHFTTGKRRSPQLVIDNNTLFSISNYDTTQVICPFKDDVSLNVKLIVYCEELWCVQIDKSLFLWNPSTRAYRKLPDPSHRLLNCRCHFFGMGYDSAGDDYKIIKIPCTHDDDKAFNRHEWTNQYPLTTGDTELYSLRNNSWRKIEAFPGGESKPCYDGGVLVNGALHWMIYPVRAIGKPSMQCPLGIISFDLSTEKYGEVAQPEYYPTPFFFDAVQLTALNGMLYAFVNYHRNALVLWGMKDYGVDESWSKTYEIKYDSIPSITPEFRKMSFNLIPLYSYEDGRILILVCVGLLESEIVTYKDEETAVQIIVGRDSYKFYNAFMHAQTLLSPALWSPQ